MTPVTPVLTHCDPHHDPPGYGEDLLYSELVLVREGHIGGIGAEQLLACGWGLGDFLLKAERAPGTSYSEPGPCKLVRGAGPRNRYGQQGCGSHCGSVQQW